MSLARLPSLGSILLLVAGVALLLAGRGDDAGSSGPGGSQPKRAEALVVEVVDGDTARMAIEGREQSVRYIGIDTPESVIPGERPECFGKRAAGLNRELVDGERVTLVFGDERRDHYGRLLAYVYLGERFVNAEIVRRGYARTLAIAPNTDFADRLDRLQQAAANAGRGLWGACG
jgi:micrococcal nuclease